MINAFFVTDLHGNKDKYDALINEIARDKPDIVFVGGDLLPHPCNVDFKGMNFLRDYLIPEFVLLRKSMHSEYPIILMIMGNDDPKSEEHIVNCGEKLGLWHYINNKHFTFREFRVFGYNFVPPTPFKLKDWEKYDINREVNPGCISPEEGKRSAPVQNSDSLKSTIEKDLFELAAEYPMDKSIFLFHSPPYGTNLDITAYRKEIADPHVGSRGIRRFIEKKQPYLALHGHIHESTRISGEWKEKIGNTFCFNGCTDSGKLALIKFPIEKPDEASLILF